MKASTFGIVAVTVLLALTGIGFGVAQAGGTHSDNPAYGIIVHEPLQVVNAPEEDMDQQPLTVVNAPEEDMDLEGPIAAGTLPSGIPVATEQVDGE